MERKQPRSNAAPLGSCVVAGRQYKSMRLFDSDREHYISVRHRQDQRQYI